MPILASLLLSLPLALGPAAPGVPYEKAARDFAAAHGLADAKPEAVRLDDALAKGFVRARLGAFEVWFPVAALAKRGADLQTCAAALVDVQVTWLDWIEQPGADQKAWRADLKATADWVKAWKPAQLAKARDAAGKDLIELAPPSEAAAAAIQRVGDALARGEPLGVPRESAAPVRLILAPTRKDFVELLCFAGWTMPADRERFWTDSVADWSQCHVVETQVIALEYAVANRKDGEYAAGMDMNAKDTGVMRQQVAQLGLNSLFDHFYEGRVPAAFLQGLGMNLVIDRYGEINTRVDGDVRARVTEAREEFVPGGMDNGVLPVNSAESRWRSEKGKDHFLPVLRQAQKEGEDLDKKVKNKLTCFAVQNDTANDRHLIVAPFLGKAAAAFVAPPEAFRGDFDELMRAYKSAFLHWLQTKAAGNEKMSRERFGALLAKLSDPNQTSGFEVVFAEVYGAPLSDPEAGKDCLEGRFLAWLAK